MNNLIFILTWLNSVYTNSEPGNQRTMENIFSVCININSQDTINKKNKRDKILEKKIVAKIFSLAEVKKKSKFIDSLTHHKCSIAIIVMGTPDKTKNYYWVQAGYNNETKFEPYYNFYVKSKDLSVLFYDPLKDKTYTMKEWRKNK
jgi:hypothetical protein